MPIYEFFCNDCNVIFSYFSRTINTTASPTCPRCQKTTLNRRVSLFAVTGKAKEKGEGAVGDPEAMPFDETKMEKAMETLASEAERADENDPRAAANLMHRLSEMTGLKYGDTMQEAITRMQAGENPEAIEAELGDALQNEEPFVLPAADERGKSRGGKKPPTRDDTLYEL